MKLSTKEVQDLWQNGNTFTLNNKKYIMHKMSYGDYFLEPEYWRGGEGDGFAQDTLWLERVPESKGQFYQVIN